MKDITKKIVHSLRVISAISLIFFVNYCVKAENFNFIKSEEEAGNFIYDGSLLLYGGIALILLSIAGMIFSIMPSRKKKRKRKNMRNKK